MGQDRQSYHSIALKSRPIAGRGGDETMTPQHSNEMFNQVRDILKKLDRSIDDARERRLASDGDVSTEEANSPSEPFNPARPGRARPMSRPSDGPAAFGTAHPQIG